MRRDRGHVWFGWAASVARVVVFGLRLCGRARGARGESGIVMRAPVKDFRRIKEKRFREDVYVSRAIGQRFRTYQSGQFSILIGVRSCIRGLLSGALPNSMLHQGRSVGRKHPFFYVKEHPRLFVATLADCLEACAWALC